MSDRLMREGSRILDKESIIKVDLTLETALADTRECLDWRNYVPGIIEEEWSELSDRERLIVALCCNEQAQKEQWE